MITINKFARLMFLLGAAGCLACCQGMINKGAVINGQKYYDRGNYDEALKQLQIADSENLEAQLLKARSYEAKGDRGMARAHYTELASKHPETAEGVFSKNKLKNY